MLFPEFTIVLSGDEQGDIILAELGVPSFFITHHLLDTTSHQEFGHLFYSYVLFFYMYIKSSYGSDGDSRFLFG